METSIKMISQELFIKPRISKGTLDINDERFLYNSLLLPESKP
jgi:hypothetical protein